VNYAMIYGSTNIKSVPYFVFETLLTKNTILTNVENICAMLFGFHTPYATVLTLPLKCKHVSSVKSKLSKP